MSDLKLFLMYVLIILIGLAVSIIITNKIIIPFLEFMSRRISSWLMSKINKNYHIILISCEILFLITTLIFIIGIFSIRKDINFGKVLITMMIYSCFIVLLSTFVIELKERIGKSNYNSILNNILNKVNKENYFINRLSIIFGKTSLGLIWFILLVYILLLGITTFQNLPYQAFYIVFILIPVGLASWVYLNSFDKTSQSLRRILAYAFLLILSFAKGFDDIKVLLGITQKNPFNDYLTFIILTVFIAIDRLAKSIIDDYSDYKKTRLK